MIQIDGRYGEGGGQILRTAVALSAITGEAVEITDIRGGRAKPGLQPQHLAAVRAAGKICSATLVGDALGSSYLSFEPGGSVEAAEYFFDIGTAGSAVLLAQTILVPLALADEPSVVVIRGGTHNPMAPTADYLEHVFMPVARQIGLNATSSTIALGFAPAGGGEIDLSIEPSTFRGLQAPPGASPSSLQARLTKLNVSNDLRDRVAAHFALRLPGVPVEVIERTEGGPGAGVALTVTTTDEIPAGFSALGAKGKPMESVVDIAINDFIRWREAGAPVDEHLADQLVLPALFANSQTSFRTSRITEHLRTVLWLASNFLDFRYSLEESTGFVKIIP